MNIEIVVAIIGGMFTITAAFIAYRRGYINRILVRKVTKLTEAIIKQNIIIQDRKFKTATLDKLVNFQSFNQIKDSVDRIFKQTKADRFQIFFAVNGKTEFRLMSVIFEQHKDTKYTVNALIRYRDVEIDEKLRKLIRDVEIYGTIDLDVEQMSPQLLKDFYIIEKVKHSKVRFLHRQSIDKDNDVVIVGTVATHMDEDWTHIENAIIKTELEGSIIYTIKEFV